MFRVEIQCLLNILISNHFYSEICLSILPLNSFGESMTGTIQKKVGKYITMAIRKALWYPSSSVKLPVKRTSFAFSSSLTELRAHYHIQSELAVSAWRRTKVIINISRDGTWREFRTGLRRRSVPARIGCIRIPD